MSLTSRITSLFSASTTTTSAIDDHSTARQLQENSIGSFETNANTKNVRNIHDAFPAKTMAQKDFEEEAEPRPPYLHAMIAGGLGGTTGDLLMHPLDTVKTRQQGDPHFPPKYTTMASSSATIFRQEGVRKGLYGGWLPAMLGSFPGTVIFFATYEYTKRTMIDHGITPQLAYLTGGFLADGAASVVYVPSEVLKTRLQLQGRYNNPHFQSGYNYRGFTDAARTLVRQEGFSALFHGYKATIFRDLPFSALQFTFYEQALKWARRWKQGTDIGEPLEFATGAVAGGLAGVITCPLDVVKTRIQTQVNTSNPMISIQSTASSKTMQTTQETATAARHNYRTYSTLCSQIRHISTSSPSTHTPRPGSITLHTSSVVTGLKLIYKTEGIAGWFRGVGPRLVWTATQSGCMLFLYQNILKQLELWDPSPESVM